LEYSKTAIKDEERGPATKAILFHIVDTGLRLLHPMMPFISEELYQKLPKFEGKAEAICIAPYPKHNEAFIFEGTQKFLDVLTILDQVRSIIGTVTITAKGRPDIYITVPETDKESTDLATNFS
jgi:valyl-tRNA synthetase